MNKRHSTKSLSSHLPSTVEFDQPDYAPQFKKAPPAEQRRHDLALKRIRSRGRKTNAPRRIQVTLEQSLLSQADDLARQQHITRSELVASSLRLALAGHNGK